jgi:hypothetical protein
MEIRTPSKIGPKVLAKHPVWEFLNDDEHPAGDTAMRPVEKFPVDRFDGRLFGAIVTLADGSQYPAAISNLAFGPKKYRHHFRSLTIFARGRRFHLAKYFQLWYGSEGPAALAAFLKKKREEVFPISYDLSDVAVGPSDVVRGVFEAEISDPMSRDQLMKILVGGR